MSESMTLRYGEQSVTLELSGAGSVETLVNTPLDPIPDLETAFGRAVGEGAVGSPPLRDLVGPDDPVTVIISDITRFWMHQDRVTSLLVSYLHDTVGVPYDRITVLCALGTHRRQTEEEKRKVASGEVFDRVTVVDHDCDAETVFVGETSRGTRVEVNPLVVGRKVIVISGTVHHMFAGFGGGRKSIMPGVCSRMSIRQNHIHSLDPDMPRSSPLIGAGVLAGNPVDEDMREAANLVRPVFGINILVDNDGKQCALICGDFGKAWEESCAAARRSMEVAIERQYDVVIASCGGYPKDISLYQAAKSLFNAALAVREGGEIVLLAECREGGGALEFFGWIENLKRGTLDPDLRAAFTISGYIFYASVEACRRCSRVLMLSEIEPDEVSGMQITSVPTVEKLQSMLDLAGKSVCVMPFGGSTVPMLPS